MKKWCIAIFLSVFFLHLSSGDSFAQDRKFVSARLINKDTKQPFSTNTLIEIYAFDTRRLGEDAYKILSQNLSEGIVGANPVMPPDADGNFNCLIPSKGALVVKVAGAPPHFEFIDGRNVIEIGIAGGNRITESLIIEKFTDRLSEIEDESEIIADTLIAKYTFKIPGEVIGDNNSRLILQPYFIDFQTGDTLARLAPYVYDGKEYKLTQERRMDYAPANDPLTEFVRPEELNPDGQLVAWKDSVWLPNPLKRYIVKGKLTVEDYNVVKYTEDNILLSSSRQRKPMQFLDYDLKDYELDRDQYYETPKPEKHNALGSMALKFLVNKSTVDKNDKEGMARLQELKSTLLSIVNDEQSWLREFHMESVSSPEGPYKTNLSLSKKRLAYVSNYLLSDIPRGKMDRVYHPEDTPTVATWEDVADSLANDSLFTQAEEVRKIAAKYSDRDRQWQTIRRLPYYKTSIIPILENMRTVRYSYKHEVFRPLTPAEVLRRYQYDEDYKSGKKHFKVSEYWELFKLLEERGADEDELFALYKRACEETEMDRGKSWIYAANKYAVACMNRGIVDTTILAPHIERSIPYSDFKRQNMNDSKKWDLFNPAAVVANQMRMYLIAYNYPQASLMAQMLPDTEEYLIPKAVTMCRGGHYKGGKTPEEQSRRTRWFTTTMESSPVNKVVMLLAMNTANYDKKAEEALKALPDNDPRTWYFKAVLSSRKLKDIMNCEWDEPDKFKEAMLKCFELAPEYVRIAYSDGDIDEQGIKALLEEFPEYNKYK